MKSIKIHPIGTVPVVMIDSIYVVYLSSNAWLTRVWLSLVDSSRMGVELDNKHVIRVEMEE